MLSRLALMVSLMCFFVNGRFAKGQVSRALPPSISCISAFITNCDIICTTKVRRVPHLLSSLSRKHVITSNSKRTHLVFECQISRFLMKLDGKDAFNYDFNNEPPTSIKKAASTKKAPLDKLNDFYSAVNKTELELIEKEVLATTQSKLDWKYVQESLLGRNKGNEKYTNFIAISHSNYIGKEDPSLVLSPLKVSLASATLCGAAVYALLQQPLVTLLVLISVFTLANRNPSDEENAIGAFFRIIGRAALQVWYKTIPKLQSIARAIIADENHVEQQMIVLEDTIHRLQIENESLRQIIARRNKIDDMLSQYTVDELKAMARKANLPVSGTKDQILSRLVENGCL